MRARTASDRSPASIVTQRLARRTCSVGTPAGVAEWRQSTCMARPHSKQEHSLHVLLTTRLACRFGGRGQDGKPEERLTVDMGEATVLNFSPWGAAWEGQAGTERKQTFPCLVGHFVIMCRSSTSDSRKSDNICFQRPLMVKGPRSEEGLSLEGLVLLRQEAC